MDKRIQQILNDIYMVDNSLREKEKELIGIIEELSRSKPDTKFDENFAKSLRLEIGRRLAGGRENKNDVYASAGSNIFARRFVFSFIGAALILIVLIPAIYHESLENGGGSVLIPGIITGGKIDDWKYDKTKPVSDSNYSGITGLTANSRMNAKAPGAVFSESNTMGFAVGGAKDINNFRKNIENNYLPLPTDITYEGLFYDYFFDTGKAEECDKLFCPSYSYAVSKDPFSRSEDYYLAVGLNSNIKESDFQRKKLNLVVVMDVSGSMGSSFDRYYYDQFGRQAENDKTSEIDSRKKIEVAASSVVALLRHLNNDDRFGMVLFDDQAYLAKPLDLVGNSDMEKIKAHILELNERGGTQMSAGMKMGSELLSELKNSDQDEYENRIIFLTDAMPNIGETSETGLLGMLKKNSENKIYTTFIGMGVDFNTELVEYITKIRGANYYSVHSAKEFKQRMDDEFDYMVTPLVFNLALNLEAEGYRIEKVYGSPEANEATGEIMKVNTLFPSKTEGGQTKGGIVLLKLRKISQDAKLALSVNYEDRNGKKASSAQNIKLGEGAEYFENTGVRKGILLARYADLMKNWINDERMSYDRPEYLKPSVGREIGIIAPPVIVSLGQWERQSVPLRVSGEYRELFGEFKMYFEKEANSIGDPSLSQELSTLEKLSR